jgi:transcriptional regulator with XRE-family HTH domain
MQPPIKLTIAIRLKTLRKTLKLSQDQFSEIVGLSQAAYSQTEQGRRKVTLYAIETLIERFNVNPMWLITGKGAMYLGENVKDGELQSNIVSLELHQSSLEVLNKELDLKNRYITSLERNSEISKKLIDALEKDKS